MTHWRLAPVLLGVLALTGCDNLTRTLGFSRDAPDEFTVTTRAPLSMPPDYALPPPRPGATRPQEQSERAKAELALAPQIALGAAPAGVSAGQDALVRAAGPNAPPDIRAEIDQQAAADRPSNGVMDKLIFWRKPRQPGIVVDPQKEAQRLRENAALGQSPENGVTPIEQPRSRALLDGIF